MSKKKRVLVNTQLVVAVARHDSRNNNNNNARPTSQSCLRNRGAEWRSPLCEALLNEYVGTVSRLVAAPVAAKDAAMQGGVA